MKWQLSVWGVLLFISSVTLGQESISVINFAGEFPDGTNRYSVEVSYSVSEQKDLFLEFQYNQKYIGGTRVTVEPGAGVETMAVTFDPALTVGNTYTLTASIRTVGGNWQTITESDTKNFVIAQQGGGGVPKEVYVSNMGDNANPGTIDAPFKTIQKASEALTNGGVCYIREGVYRETVTVKYSNQTFMGYNHEYVVVTGLDLLSNWTPYKGDIYKCSFSGFEPAFTQVFYNGKHQQIARYPDNKKGDMLRIADDCGYAALEVKNDGKVTFDVAPPGGPDYWKGGYFRAISGLTWMNPTGKIIASSGADLTCEMISKSWQQGSDNTTGEGKGYILHLNALSMPGEWYQQDNSIYFWKPGSGKPNDVEVEAQKREFAFVLDGRSNIRLKNLDIKAASMRMDNANNCTIENCSFRFQKGWYTRPQYHWSYTEHGGVYVKGDNNTFSKCFFYGTWGNLLNFKDGANSTVENCIFDNSGWMSMFTACIQTNCYNLTVKDATFGSTGRFHIRSDKKFNVLHSDFYDCMKLGQDAGSLEVTNGGNTGNPVQLDGAEIAYNTFHDMNTLVADRYNKNFVVAIYFEGATNYRVHHNLVYNIQTQFQQGSFVYLGPRECAVEDLYYYNNTVWNIDKAIGVWNKNSKGQITNARFANNIFDSRASVNWGTPSLENGVVWENNLSSQNANVFENVNNSNYTLREGSEAMDYGQVIDGITDGYNGAAPDAGCFEYGNDAWSSGAAMAVPSFPEDSTNNKHWLLVLSGSGDGEYEQGETFMISADSVPNMEFVAWIGDVDNVENPTESPTLLTMPNANVTLEARYRDKATSIGGAKGYKGNSYFEMYPNPNSGKVLRVKIEDPGKACENLIVYGINGTIKQQSPVKTNIHTDVDIAQLAPGIYFVKAGKHVQKLVVR